MRTRNKSSFVIGIGSVSGGGKTAVAKKLAELLQDAVILCFDNYDDTTVHPEDLHARLTAGADYNVWKTLNLAHSKPWKETVDPESMEIRAEGRLLLARLPLPDQEKASGIPTFDTAFALDALLLHQ